MEKVLRLGAAPFTVGRSSTCALPLRWARDNVSRVVAVVLPGVVELDGPGSGEVVWFVENQGRHPIRVAINGASAELPPDCGAVVGLRWGQATIEINQEQPDPILLRVGGEPLRAEPPLREPAGPPAPSPDELVTFMPSEPTPHERMLLGAKFLSQPRLGDAVGDRDAADRVNANLPAGEGVTPKAVEDCVAKWRRYLEENFSVANLGGRENINNLGRALLHFRIISELDRLPRDPGQPPG